MSDCVSEVGLGVRLIGPLIEPLKGESAETFDVFTTFCGLSTCLDLLLFFSFFDSLLLVPLEVVVFY